MALINSTLSDSSAVVFTCSNSGGSALTSLWLKNHSGSAVTVTIHACPSGEAEADENMLMEVSVPANDSYIIDTEKLILSNTDTIEMFAGTASVITTTISYLDL